MIMKPGPWQLHGMHVRPLGLFISGIPFGVLPQKALAGMVGMVAAG